MPRGRKKLSATPEALASVEPENGSADVERDDGRMLSDYPMCDRTNADKIVGRKALVQLGQSYGMLVCQMMDMSLERLRQQIKYAQINKATEDWQELQESAV